MRKTWRIKHEDKTLQKELSQSLSISITLAQLLINRGIKTKKQAEDFMHPSLLKLHDPFLMKGMKEAVSRIKKAVENKENIVIYGDYDVDGISATALMTVVLKGLGAKVDHYIPNRLEDGYGISPKGIEHVKKMSPGLVITVDCGITAVKEADDLTGAGIDLIITDHHSPSEKSPKAHAILNPHQKDCHYPDKNLSGVGVAFKLASALLGHGNNALYEHLDLVCLGTISDVVPLVGENRILAKNGLDQLTHTKKQGLKALIEAASLDGKEMTSHYVGFVLGPRINATGRLGSPEKSLRLLLTDDAKEAEELAGLLNQENKSRQQMEDAVLRQALGRIEREVDFSHDKVIVLDGEGWHKGVIGIVASRIVDRFHRPAIMLSVEGEEAKGSCRSISAFHIVEALGECAELLSAFGGHKQAAGLTIQKDRVSDFRKKINDVAHRKLIADDLIPTISADIEMPISKLNRKFLNELEELGPFGMGNPKPVFVSRNLKLKRPPEILRRGTIKMWITDGNTTAEAIGYNMADSITSDPLNQEIDIIYNCSLNTYKGITSICLQLKDLRLSDQSSIPHKAASC